MRTVKDRKDKDWIELCEYVKREILEYDDNMMFPKHLAFKLQGIKRGQHIANNNMQKKAHYDDYTLLCTFKICKKKIIDYLHKNENKIKDENHKINLIIKMIEPEINDVYLRIKAAQKTVERVEEKSFDNQVNEHAEYARKTKDVNEKMKELF